MSTSYWGVDHGVEIAKSAPRNNNSGPISGSGMRGGEGAGVALGGGLYGAYKARKGRKAAVLGRMAGRGFAEGQGGGVGGAILGAAASRGNPEVARAASSVGSLAGSMHGGLRAYGNARRRGDIR